MNPGLITLMVCATAVSLALAQTAGDAASSNASRTRPEQEVRSVESERARLGQQRIPSEVEARAREEQQRLAAEEERARLGQQRIQAEVEAREREEQQRLAAEEERARLGQQRIQAEAEAREREEQQRLAAEQEQSKLAREEAMRSEAAIAPGSEVKPTATGTGTDMSRILKQLRSLGELRDDGYITEDEFQRIKQKILDSQT